MTSPLQMCGCWSVVYIRRFIYKVLDVFPLNHTAVVWVGRLGPLTSLTYQLGDWSYPSRSTIANWTFWWRFCFVTLPFSRFCWWRGFCHRTESDLVPFLFQTLTFTTKKKLNFKDSSGTFKDKSRKNDFFNVELIGYHIKQSQQISGYNVPCLVPQMKLCIITTITTQVSK